VPCYTSWGFLSSDTLQQLFFMEQDPLGNIWAAFHTSLLRRLVLTAENV
jgi:hypothetical protein